MVPPRVAVGATVQVGPKPPVSAPVGQSNFPPAMRAYVERAFLSAKTAEQKKILQPALKQVPRPVAWSDHSHPDSLAWRAAFTIPTPLH